MKFPKKVIVRGYNYNIDYVATNREVDIDLNSNEYVGQVSNYDPGRGQIYVKSTREPIKVFDTLIHELLHTIFNRNPLLKAAIKSEISDEAFIDTLGCEIAYLLVSNSWIKLPKQILVTKKRING